MNYPDIFMKHFYQSLAPLAEDKVPNVRIAVAKILRRAFEKKSK